LFCIAKPLLSSLPRSDRLVTMMLSIAEGATR
jgi:hypothetical protein